MFGFPTLVLDARKAYDSGIGTYIRNLIPFLKQEFDLQLIGNKQSLEGFDCKVLALDSKTYSLADFYKPSVLAGPCDIFWTPHFNFPLYLPKAKLKVASIHDVYHLAHWQQLSIPQKIYYKIFLGNLVKSADLIFTISDFSKSEISHYYPSAASKLEMIHLGVDFQHFKTGATPWLLQKAKEAYSLPDTFVLFVGNLKPNKNVMALLRAYHAICEADPAVDWKVIIVGKKDGFKIGDNEAIDFIHQNGLQDRVLFTGFVKEEDLPLVYQLATLFVFPSLYEGFGLPPLEAIACGCPVACSTSASLPEVCQDHVHYFDGNDFLSLKMLLSQLMLDKSFRNSKTEAATSWVKKYDWSTTAERHIRALKDGLTGKKE
jgi:glycosyltransferase involved in cell wall biosynthesis